jgi:class 3 adenylate cyclase/predicted ATPase
VTDDIQSWLEQIGLERYGPVFAEHEITLDLLPDLTEADIDQLALPTGPRRQLMVAIQELAVELRCRAPGKPSTSLLEQPGTGDDAEERQLTVMLCALVNPAVPPAGSGPEELREVTEAYRKAVGEVVRRYQGCVVQDVGERLMIYFGWPNAHEDDAERCVRASLEIVREVRRVSPVDTVAVRIGVTTGTAVMGEASRALSAEGGAGRSRTFKLAARLQELAGPHEVVIASATRRLIGDTFDLTDLGERALEGMAEPLRVWRVDAVRRTQGRFEAAHAAVPLTPLVGREEEVALLLRAWRQAREGEGRVVLIGGEPGIGKSRLVQVLHERIAGERYADLRYQCSPYHLNSPLYPITEQIEAVAGFARDDTPEQKLDKLEALLQGSPEQHTEAVPLFAALLSLPTERYPPHKLSPRKQKERTLEALSDQIEIVSRREPVLMVFEDVHWIDPTTQEALDVLVPRIGALSVLLVITHRQEYTPHWSEDGHVTTLGLSRLVRRQGEELVAKLTGGRALPAEVLDLILSHTDGVPLFVEELTKSVLESGGLREAGDQYLLQTPSPALVIPTSLRDSLLARLDHLAAAKSILQAGACIGRTFSYELLVHISALSDAQLEEALRKLTGAGLVHRRGTPPDAIYTFKHALVQDAAYDSLLTSKRQQLHAQLAQALSVNFAARVASEPELLAHHYAQSGDLTRAIPLWGEAGKLAARRGALREAAGHFQKALTSIERLPASSERDELELSIREPLNGVWTGLRGWAASEVNANALVLLDVAKRRGESRTLAVGLWAIWVGTITRGRVADSLAAAQRLLAEGELAGDLDLRIFGHGAAMISQFYLGELVKAREHGNQVLALYDPNHADRWMQVTASDFRTLVGIWSCQWTWMLGYPDQAVRLSDERDAYAQTRGNAFNRAFALTLGAYVFDYRCEPERLLEHITEAERLAREHSIPFMHEVMIPQAEGLARLRGGQLPEAVLCLRRGLDAWHKRGGHSRVPYLKSALAEAVALQGDLNTALGLIEEVVEQIERSGWQERSHLAEVLRLKGWMLIRQGRRDAAEAALRAAVDWARRQQARSWELRASTTLAGLLFEHGRRDAARSLLAPIYDWFAEGFDTHDLKAARSLLDSVR